MKRACWDLYMLLSCVLLAGCAPLTVGVTSTGVPDSSPWHQVRQMVNEHSVAMAEFIDENRGFTVGCKGIVHYTTDGGATWPMANNQSDCLWDLDIVDEQVAWIVGNAGNVRFSTDGWRNWQATADISNHTYQFVSFVDARTGWAASAGARLLWATLDSGQTWVQVTLPPKVQTIVDVMLRTATDGYMLDSAGMLYITQDGGQNWFSRSLGLGKETIPPYVHTAAIRFFSAEQGVIVLNLQAGSMASVVALRTADGGQTWQREQVPTKPGYLDLSRDGKMLTVLQSDKSYQAGFNALRPMAVFRYQEPTQ